MKCSDLIAGVEDDGQRESLNIVVRAKKITTGEQLLELSLAEVQRACGFPTLSTASSLLSSASASYLQLAQCIPHAVSDAPHAEELSFGCPLLDSAVGRVLCGAVTEIAGESAAGKTQLCLQLCLAVQLPAVLGGLGGGAAYVCTEGAFPQRRFDQLKAAFARERPAAPEPRLWTVPAIQTRAAEYGELFSSIEAMCYANPIRLLVIDSVAALFRSEFGRDGDYQERAESMWGIAHVLHRVASRGIAVVVVNQVTDVFGGSPEDSRAQRDALVDHVTAPDFVYGSAVNPALRSRPIQPSLGLGWSNCINARMLVSRTQKVHVPSNTPVRRLQVVFAPHRQRCTSFFFVDADGAHGIVESEL